MASFLDAEDSKKACLISMWVAPTHRRLGVGRSLVDQVIDWARSRQVQTLSLMATSINDGAMCFYQRMGFIRTGRTIPYPNDSGLVEFEMIRPIENGSGRT